MTTTCSKCGGEITEDSAFCPNCGNATKAAIPEQNTSKKPTKTAHDISPKSAKVALFLAMFFGMFGFHRFYVGKVGTGVLMFLTAGGLGIWILVDLVAIVTNKFTDEGKKILLFHKELSDSKKAVSIGGVILTWIAIFAAFIIGLIFYATSGIVNLVDNEIQAIKDGDMTKAYALTSTDFQKAMTAEMFETYVNEYPALKNNSSYFFTHREIENNMATVSGTLTGKDGVKTPIEFKLIRENGNWRILIFRVGKGS